MLYYLLSKIRERQHQVVISTHSPTLVRSLPREAIKVFSLNASGLVDVEENRPSQEAFYYIGHRYDADINLIVEDKLAKAVIDSVIDSQGEAFKQRFRVSFGAGGDSAIKKQMPVYAGWPTRPTIIFDGDKAPTVEADRPTHIETSKIAIGDRTPDRLRRMIAAQAGQEIEFAFNSNMTDEEKCHIYIRYLDYYSQHVFYLPFPTPEQAIWSDAACRHLIESAEPDPDSAERQAKEVIALPDYKARFAKLAELVNVTEDVHRIFVLRFGHTKGEGWYNLLELLKRIEVMYA